MKPLTRSPLMVGCLVWMGFSALQPALASSGPQLASLAEGSRLALAPQRLEAFPQATGGATSSAGWLALMPETWEGTAKPPSKVIHADWIRDDAVPPRARLPRFPSYAERIRAAVREEGKALQQCYLDGLKDDPSLHGELSVLFQLDATGAVKQSRIEFSTLSGPAMEPCVLQVFARLRLPSPPRAEYNIRYPLVFTSERTPKEILTTLKARYGLEVVDGKEKKGNPKDYKGPKTEKESFKPPW